MLHTIRDFGRAQLADTSEIELIRDRHFAWCLAVAEDAEARFYFGDHWIRTMGLLEEIDNIREALSWAFQTSPGEKLPQLTARLWWPWAAGGSLREGEAWLAQAIAHDDQRDPLIWVKNLVGAGFIATFQGNFEKAREMWQRARPIAVDVRDPRLLGLIDFGQGLGEQDEGKPNEAQRSFESALATFRQGDRAELLEGLALANLGVVTARLGDIESGRQILTQALEINRSGNHSWNTTLTLRYLGQLAKDSGDLDEAERYFVGALQIEVLGILGWHVANSLEGLAEVSYLRNRAVRAARLYAVAERIRTEIGAPLEPALLAQQEEILRSVRGLLGKETFDRQWQDGARLSVADVIADTSEVEYQALSNSARPSDQAGLTRRELEILRLFAAGKSMQDVSDEANISPRTVSTHLSNIYAKFDVSDRGAAVARAYQLGLVKRSEKSEDESAALW
jgi:DNA-binding CsgD family transcriptional regulator/Tfp pilus assembly protein PilF